MRMSFSVLQSVYKKDSPQYLAESLRSLAENTVQPAQVVLVKDGTLTAELEEVITEWQARLPLKVVGYEENHGLSYALNYGLRFVETELVARMDSDDICLANRFEKQIGFMEQHSEISLCSGFIAEFNKVPNVTAGIREVPLEHKDISRCLKRRNAFNHMAVCFRKSAVVAAGGYEEVPFFEDYDLWIRMVQKGFVTANMPEVLVYARVGNDMVGRRHGARYALFEIQFLKRQLRSGFISLFEFIIDLLLRIPLRLLPKFLLAEFYKFLRKVRVYTI